MLEILYSNCEDEDEDAARLYGLGDLHHRTPNGTFVTMHGIEIVSFVNERFDPERGDMVLVECRERGSKFQGATQLYPFASHVKGEGWDNMQLVHEVDVLLEKEEEIKTRLKEAQMDDDIDISGMEQSIADLKRVHPITEDKEIRQRNLSLNPSIRDALAAQQNGEQPHAKLFVVAGMAHFTENATLYPTIKQVKYNIYGDKSAPYLRGRFDPPVPRVTRRKRRGI